MSDADEVQRLLQKTRDRRERLNKRLATIGESPHPIRSPLKERNSPTKSVVGRSDTFTKSDAKSSSSKAKKSFGSPRKSTETKEHAIILDDGGKVTEKETLDKEVTEKTTVVEDEPKREGNREVHTKTTITEKEEKIHKTQYVRFTEVNNTPAAKEKLLSLANKYEVANDATTTKEDLPRVASPIRYTAAPSRLIRSSPTKDMLSSPSRRAPSPPKAKTPVNNPAEVDDDDFHSARKKRMSAFAAKYKYMDEDEEVGPLVAVRGSSAASPRKLDVSITKEVDVDEELAEIEENKILRDKEQERRHRSDSPTKNLAKDPEFVSSLKAQGYEESNSKSKLVYEFNRKPRSRSSSPVKSTILSSPTKTAAEPAVDRPPSPYKPHPLQFVSPQVNRALSPTRQVPKVTSPSKGSSSVAGRAVSPFKSHPLQFVSPQHAAAASPTAKAPVKPVRTWATIESEQEMASEEGTDVAIKTPREAAPPPPPKPMTDTASRRSILEKRSFFEGETKEASPEVDPAMLTLSQRKALFEKNRTAPKPVARFGESVTPSMLHKGQQQNLLGAQEPRRLFATPQPPRPSGMRMGMAALSPEKSKKDSPKRVASPIRNQNSPKRLASDAGIFAQNKEERKRSPSPPKPKPVSPKAHYPGVNSLKKVKMSPPKPGSLYPQVMESSGEESDVGSIARSSPPKWQQPSRPNTAMSEESNPESMQSEAPSLGTDIKRAASAHRLMQQTMPSISEKDCSKDEDFESSVRTEDIDDILDEAMDEEDDFVKSPPKSIPTRSPYRSPYRSPSRSPTQSATSWEYQTPSSKKPHDFKTPLVEGIKASPQGELPQIEGEEGSKLLHTVSFYRKQKPSQPSSYQKIVRKEGPMIVEEQEQENPKEAIQREISKLQEEAEEQRQTMEQASKALNFCVSQNEFEGSAERVEGERLLLQSSHKYYAAMAEIRRLGTEGAIGKSSDSASKKPGSKGAISISDLSLPLKTEFLRLMTNGSLDDTVHYFIILVKYKARVIATQMLSTIDGVQRDRLAFSNLINLRDLDYDFQIDVEVYGLQTRRERLSHEIKYHIKKEKSMFNLTPLKKIRKQDARPFLQTNQNPVNSKTIRRPAFGMVGYAVINIDTLKNKGFELEKVPEYSPLQGGLEMTLTIHSESKVEQHGFLTLFTDVNGYGDWCRRWCRLSGNSIRFWKYPEDENTTEPTEVISLSQCVTKEVALAPRDICSRMNTFMLETRRQCKKGDSETLVMRVNRNSGHTTIRHLLSADTRDERLGWCSILNCALDNIRSWNPMAYRPRAGSDASQTSTGLSSYD